MEFGRATIGIYADAKAAIAEIKRLKSRVRTETKEMASAFKRVNQSLSGISRIGRRSFLVLGGAMTGAMVAAGKFEAELANVSTMLDEAGMVYLPKYEQGLTGLSVKFGESTSTLSKGLYDILSASIGPAKAMDVLNVSAMAATAGLTDTGTAADAITTIMNSYSLAAEDAESISDLLFATVLRGKTTFAELAPAIGMVASMASQAGMSLEEMSAILSTATRNGVNTRVAVTGLNAILMAFVKKPGKEAIEVAKKYGIELNTTWLKANGFIEVIKKMSKASTEEQAAVFKNTRALRSLMPVLGDTAGYYRDIELAMNRAGLTMKAFEKQTDTLVFEFKQLKQAAVALIVSIGNIFSDTARGAGIFESVKNAIMSVTSAIDGLDPATKRTVATMAALVLGLAGVLSVVGIVGGAIAALAAGPVAGLLAGIAVVGGLAGGFILLNSMMNDTGEGADHLRSRLNKLQSDVKKAASDFVEKSKAINSLVGDYEALKTEMGEMDKTTDEYANKQERLNGLLERIEEIVPDAITTSGEYKKAIDLNKEAIDRYNISLQAQIKMELRLARAKAMLMGAEGKRLIAEYGNGIENARKNAEHFSKQIQFFESTAKQMGMSLNTQGRNLKILVNSYDDAAAKVASYDAGLAMLEVSEETLVIVNKQLNDVLEDGIVTKEEAAALIKKMGEAGIKAGADIKKGTEDAADGLKDLGEQAKQTEEQYIEMLDRIQRDSHASTSTILNLLDQEIARRKAANETYEDLAEARVGYEAQAVSEMTQIWGGWNDSIKSSMSTALADMIKGTSDIKDAFKNMGESIKNSFIDAFAESLVKKSAFDMVLKGNILDIGGWFGGMGQSITSSFGGIFEGISSGFSSIFGGGAAATGMSGITAGTAGMTTAAAQEFVTLGVAAEGAATGLTAVGTASTGLSSITAGTSEMTAAAAQEFVAVEGAATGAATATTAASTSLLATLGPAALAGGHLMALSGQFGEEAAAADGLTTSLGLLSAGFMGAGLAALAFKGDEWLTDLGVIKHGKTWSEQFSSLMGDFQEGTLRQDELFGALFLRATNYANDYYQTHHDLLEDSYGERLAFFKQYEDMDIFTEDQLSTLRDALQLYETEAERAGAATRTALEVASHTFEDKMWNIFKEFPHLMDEIGGVGDAFEAAFARMQTEGIGLEEAFREELAKLPGISEEALLLVDDAFNRTVDNIDTTISSGLTNSFRDFAAQAGSMFSGTVDEIGGFFKDVEDVAKMFLDGWDIDLEDALGKIPGMTERLKDNLVDELANLKEAGTMEFGLGDQFKQQFEEGFAHPESVTPMQEGPIKIGQMGIFDNISEIETEMVNFTQRLGELGTDLSDLNETQAESILSLIDAENSSENQQRIMGKTAEEVRKELLELSGAASMTESEFNALTDEQRNFIGELTGFDFANYVGPLRWSDFVRHLNMGDYINGVDLSDFVTPATVPGFASGTDYFHGGMALVGERGPEIINIPRGAQIIPNSEIRGNRMITINKIIFRNYGDIHTEADYQTVEKRMARTIENSLARI